MYSLAVSDELTESTNYRLTLLPFIFNVYQPSNQLLLNCGFDESCFLVLQEAFSSALCFDPRGKIFHGVLETLLAKLKCNSNLIQVSHYLSADASVSANTTPAVSHVTAAARALTRRHGALQPLTARMNVSVSVRVHRFTRCVFTKPTQRCSPLCWLLTLQPWEWTEVSSCLLSVRYCWCPDMVL